MSCLNTLAPLNAEVVPLAPLAYGGCGSPAPVLLRSLGGGTDRVRFDPPLLVNCPVVAALNAWLQKTVQPAARADLGSPVASITGSSYACRTPYNRPSDRLSQHAYANAVDLPVFVLADGRTISVTKGWGPAKRDLVAHAKPKLIPIVAKDESSDPKSDAAAKAAAPASTASDGKADATPMVVKASATSAIGVSKPKEVQAAPQLDPLNTQQAKFLRAAHRGACDTFSTVLGPEANDVHRTHLHLDLQDRNTAKVCR
jgi:hypothetical protein